MWSSVRSSKFAEIVCITSESQVWNLGQISYNLEILQVINRCGHVWWGWFTFRGCAHAHGCSHWSCLCHMDTDPIHMRTEFMWFYCKEPGMSWSADVCMLSWWQKNKFAEGDLHRIIKKKVWLTWSTFFCSFISGISFFRFWHSLLWIFRICARLYFWLTLFPASRRQLWKRCRLLGRLWGGLSTIFNMLILY